MSDIPIEIVCGNVDKQVLLNLQVAKGSCVREAILQSNILSQFPMLNLDTIKVGIFSHPTTLATPLRANDRIEIYAPLKCDPKAVRRARARV